MQFNAKTKRSTRGTVSEAPVTDIGSPAEPPLATSVGFRNNTNAFLWHMLSVCFLKALELCTCFGLSVTLPKSVLGRASRNLLRTKQPTANVPPHSIGRTQIHESCTPVCRSTVKVNKLLRETSVRGARIF